MKKILVVGGSSFDTLHLKDRTVKCAGGAGMYTAMAARRCGAQVTMFSIRPDPCPDFLQPVVEHLTEWLGPLVSPEEQPRFEISYGQETTDYLDIFLGSIGLLSPMMLPEDLSDYDLIHVIQRATLSRQLSFVQACRDRGAKKISIGTCFAVLDKNPQDLHALIEASDYFFLNELEAGLLFGSLDAAHAETGKVFFVTMGKKGACIIQGDTVTTIPAVFANELDPTGAGDTFCGATLAYLLQKQHPIMAARRATVLAAEMIEQVGPTALLSDDPPPQFPLESSVQINEQQVRHIADIMSTLSAVVPFHFTGPGYPPVGHPKTVEYFFAATLQQFSFWTERNGRYNLPLIAEIGGVERKGSDYLWEAYRRAVDQDPDYCSPQRQANLSHADMLELFRADNGADPMPALELHLQKAHDYGRDMLALGLTPQALLNKALESDQPLQTFLELLDHIGGYKEDPLRKKSSLLAMILNQRPETFLPLRDDEELDPVIDYHALRSCLRMGLIDVMDEQLHKRLRSRALVSPAEEWAIRVPAYLATQQVADLSAKSAGAVDQYFFNARKRCPEMSEPQCQLCEVDPICAHRKELFQPVLRTSFY